MTTKLLLPACLCMATLFMACGPSDVEKRAAVVAQAKDDALKLRQQLAQSKSGAEAESLRQKLVKGLTDAGLTVDSIHFTDAELNGYVKAANAASAPPPEPKHAKPARAPKTKRTGKRKKAA